METQTITLRAVCRRLFSRGIRFHKNAGSLLDRLDDITYLLNLRDTDPTLGKDIHHTVLSGLETIKDLSFYVKDFVLNLEIDHDEFSLLKQVLQHQSEIRKVCDFQYFIGYEWEYCQFNPVTQYIEIHRGDLVLMNDYGSFLVIELKHINPIAELHRRSRRGRRIRHVRQQTEKFRSLFQSRFPWARVEGLALTNTVSYLCATAEPLQHLEGILVA